MPLTIFLLAEQVMQPVASNPFVLVEWYAFQVTVLILFVAALYKLVRNELKK